MKRELAALVLLLVLFWGAMANVQHIDTLTDDIRQDVLLSAQAAARGDYPEAENHLRHGQERFVGAALYTQVFIRHAEIDSCMDAFFDCAAALRSQEGKAAEAACEKLLYHLRCIDEMEHPLPGSIF